MLSSVSTLVPTDTLKCRTAWDDFESIFNISSATSSNSPGQQPLFNWNHIHTTHQKNNQPAVSTQHTSVVQYKPCRVSTRSRIIHHIIVICLRLSKNTHSPLRIPYVSASHLRRVVYIWYMTLRKLKMVRISMFTRKSTIPNTLANKNDEKMYDLILGYLNHSDSLITDMDQYIRHMPLSGRTIDVFMTHMCVHKLVRIGKKYAELDTSALTYSMPPPQVNDDQINISVSYKRQLTTYGKRYFDCFARGNILQYVTQDNKYIGIPLCQYMFYIWARRYGVISYIYSIKKTVLQKKAYLQRLQYMKCKHQHKAIMNDPMSRKNQFVYTIQKPTVKRTRKSRKHKQDASTSKPFRPKAELYYLNLVFNPTV